jgi:hypothetical protein
MKYIHNFNNFLNENKTYNPTKRDIAEFITALNLEMINKKIGSFWEDHDAEGVHRFAIGKYDHDHYSDETIEGVFLGIPVRDPRQKDVRMIELELDSHDSIQSEKIRNVFRELGLNLNVDNLIKKYLEK